MIEGEWDYRSIDLQLRHAFALSVGIRSQTKCLILSCKVNGRVLFGECTFPPYLKYKRDTAIKYFEKMKNGERIKYKPLEAAIDMIEEQVEASDYSALGSPQAKPTSYTVSYSSDKDFLQQLESAKSFEILKLKMGTSNDERIWQLVMENWKKEICIDFNQGFDMDKINYWSKAFEKRLPLFVEQPFVVGNDLEISRFKSKIETTVIADESLQSIEDLIELSHLYDGINIKLLKCGGVKNAIELMTKAKKLGLMTLVGCMTSSSCAISAAIPLSKYADFVDLDGAFLLQNDPFKGLLEVINGRVLLKT